MLGVKVFGLIEEVCPKLCCSSVGEPDICLHNSGNAVTVEIQGLDIYDPIKDEVKARSVADIAYWMGIS